MRFLMLISADRGRAERWHALSPEEKDAAEAPLREWFERHGAAGRIESGHELAFPRDTVTYRPGEAGPVVSHGDGDEPALLSGVIVLETETVEEAAKTAASWPDLVAEHDAVTIVPIRDYGP